MKASFTDFKLSLGINNDTNDTQYANLMRGIIQELYSTYGIALTKDILLHTETINGKFDTPIKLIYKNIISIEIDSFIEDIDYKIDLEQGILTILSTGNMLEDTNYTVSYKYYLFLNKSNTIEYIIYPSSDTNIYHIDVKPFTIIDASYNGNTLTEDVDYYLYENKFEMRVAPSNYRKPIILNLNVGYEEIPYDLKNAFYELVDIRFDMIDRKTYLIDKVTDNSQGTTVTYSKDSIPKHIKSILMQYTGRRFFI